MHNLLVDAAAGVTVLDRDWGGWDDPAQLVMGFPAHAGSAGLSAQAAAACFDGYAEQARLSATESARFERAAMLLDAE